MKGMTNASPGVGQFAAGKLGTIKGGTADGSVQAQEDGTGTVVGWSGKASTADVAKKADKTALDATDAKVTQIQTAVGDCFNTVSIDGDKLSFTAVDGQVNTITLPTRTATEWIATVTPPTDTQQLNSCFDAHLDPSKPITVDTGNALIKSYAIKEYDYIGRAIRDKAAISDEDKAHLCQILGDGTYYITLGVVSYTGLSTGAYTEVQQFIISNGVTASDLFLIGSAGATYTVTIRSCLVATNA